MIIHLLILTYVLMVMGLCLKKPQQMQFLEEHQYNGNLPIDLDDNLKKGTGLKVIRKSSIFNYDDQKFDFNTTWDIVNNAIKNELFPGAQILVVKR